MNVDTEAMLDAFGQNKQVQNVFWMFFIATAGLLLAQGMHPGTAERIVETLMGIVPYGITGFLGGHKT